MTSGGASGGPRWNWGSRWTGSTSTARSIACVTRVARSVAGPTDAISSACAPVREAIAARRARRMLGANPLTFLPGGPAIEEEAAVRIKTGAPLAFFYVDIDNFKAYNDTYGYLNGDNAIKCVAGLLTDLQNDFAGERMFVGHIGGDDFVVMANPARAEELARAIAAGFDAMVPGFYSEADRARGMIVSKDRGGASREFPLMTLTIAIATNEKRVLDHYAKIVDISAEMKRHLKSLKNRTGSIYLKDRRGD